MRGSSHTSLQPGSVSGVDTEEEEPVEELLALLQLVERSGTSGAPPGVDADLVVLPQSSHPPDTTGPGGGTAFRVFAFAGGRGGGWSTDVEEIEVPDCCRSGVLRLELPGEHSQLTGTTAGGFTLCPTSVRQTLAALTTRGPPPTAGTEALRD